MERVNEIFNCFGKNDVLFLFKCIWSHWVGNLTFSLCKTKMKGLTGNIMNNYSKVNKYIINFQAAFCNNPVLLPLNSMAIL